MTELENDGGLAELQQAFGELVNSLETRPIIYEKDEETDQTKVIWVGKLITGPDWKRLEKLRKKN